MINNLWESFNARNYTPAQVARTFISNSDYEQLWRNEHTIVLGPRGSGKTTLFKMLTVQAIFNWDHPFAESLKKERPFTAIYVPTDMQWHHQLKHAETHLERAPQFKAIALQTAITTSILLAIVRTFQERLQYELGQNFDREAELCLKLIGYWHLPKSLPTFEDIILSLKVRISDIRMIINRAIHRESSDLELKEQPSFFYLDYMAALDLACSAFDQTFEMPSASKWALCLDELELAPPWLQNLAFSQQRSTEQKHLIKLSTSPIPSILSDTEARPRHDLKLITIWNHASRGNDGFSVDLTKAVLKRRLGQDIDPETLFGRTDIALEADIAVDKYERGSVEWRMLKQLASWDISLRTLLLNANIDPDDPVAPDAAARDSILRKIKPVAVLRQAFLKGKGGSGISLRSRKIQTVYYGCEAIYRVSDGNPRRLIGILDDLCLKIKQKKDGGFERLNHNDQAEVLTRASANFTGYIHALPGATMNVGTHSLDLASLLKTVASFFRQSLLGPEFPLDPIGSFKVDSHTNDTILELLRLGVYHGALVHVNPLPDSIETSLRGKRFRLSYMLAPINRLSLTLYPEISLNYILKATPRLRVTKAILAIEHQQELKLSAKETL